VGPAASFLPALLAVVACFDVMSVYLVVGEFRDSGDRRVLMMSCAYMWSLVTMAAYAAAFPDVLSSHPPLALTPSMAPWFYICWHGGFPVLLGLAWARWPSRWVGPTPAGRRKREAVLTITATAVAASAVVTLLAVSASTLPTLIHGVDTGEMTRLTGPVTVPLTVLSVVTTYRNTRDRTGPERWAAMVILVCLSDLILTYTAGYRYSAGWYAGRTMTLIASGVILVATISALRRAKEQAQENSRTDGLTGLANRTSAHRDLQMLIDGARRTHAPLSVVTFDIDLFKQVNDRHGHGAGDRVLAGIGHGLKTWLRVNDIVARVGGEEFLVVLVGTSAPDARMVAEKLRQLVADSGAARHHQPVTISLGVATLQQGETLDSLLRRSDLALYTAKRQGRNQTCTAEDVTLPPTADLLSPAPGSTVVAGGEVR
jgi:diguanylate cyclase (GGDEF)-like protein